MVAASSRRLHCRTPRCVGPLNKIKTLGYHQRFVTALPNIHFEVLHVLAEGDHVLIHWMASGTHDERLATVTGETIPPTQRSVRVSGALLIEVRDGNIYDATRVGQTHCPEAYSPECVD